MKQQNRSKSSARKAKELLNRIDFSALALKPILKDPSVDAALIRSLTNTIYVPYGHTQY